MEKNRLYFGDCLEILKELHQQHPQGFIDLIYIDPPFNSKRDYNILFESIDLTDATAQKQAFADTWSNVSYIDTLNELSEIDIDLYKFLIALDSIRLSKSAVAYLTTMAIRIYYMHKVLKDTGSFYLHCDPTMSHYLKLVCDLVFGQKNFINEIAWKRTTTHNDTKQGAKHFGRVHDTIFRYSKNYLLHKFIPIYKPYSKDYINSTYKRIDDLGRRFKASDLSAAKPGGDTNYEWKGIKPPKGRFWAYSYENMMKFENGGRLFYSKSGKPYYKHYLDEMPGVSIDDIWFEIEELSLSESERLGYPTQKPEALLERIIKASSNEGDLVADFFCGCGTTISVAQKLKRRWLGVDISHLAIRLIIDRLTKPYNKNRAKTILENIEVSGMPKDLASAKELAKNTADGRFVFQNWITEVMLGGVRNPKRTGDGGYDGYITFIKEDNSKGFALIEVKSGKVTVKNIREFIQVVDKQNADIGVFVCFKETVTKEMLREAKLQGHYNKERFLDKFPKLQILTVEDLMDGQEIKMPTLELTTFKKATKKDEVKQDQIGLF